MGDTSETNTKVMSRELLLDVVALKRLYRKIIICATRTLFSGTVTYVYIYMCVCGVCMCVCVCTCVCICICYSMGRSDIRDIISRVVCIVAVKSHEVKLSVISPLYQKRGNISQNFTTAHAITY